MYDEKVVEVTGELIPAYAMLMSLEAEGAHQPDVLKTSAWDKLVRYMEKVL